MNSNVPIRSRVALEEIFALGPSLNMKTAGNNRIQEHVLLLNTFQRWDNGGKVKVDFNQWSHSLLTYIVVVYPSFALEVLSCIGFFMIEYFKKINLHITAIRVYIFYCSLVIYLFKIFQTIPSPIGASLCISYLKFVLYICERRKFL